MFTGQNRIIHVCTSGIISLGAAMSTLAQCAGSTATCDAVCDGTDWCILNGGQEFDLGATLIAHPSGRLNFGSLSLEDDSIVFAAATRQDTVFGRLTATHAWELLTDAGWCSDELRLPSNPHGAIGILLDAAVLVRHPKSHLPGREGDFMGVAGVSVGTSAFAEADYHRHASHFQVEAGEIKHWFGGIAYDPYYSQAMASEWNGLRTHAGSESRTSFDFAYDPRTLRGLCVNMFGAKVPGPVHIASQLVASRYDYNDATHSFRRWDNGWRNGILSEAPGWWINNTYPHWDSADEFRASFVLDHDIDVSQQLQGSPRVTLIPYTDQSVYFITFLQRSEGASDTSPSFLHAALYSEDLDGDNPQWLWWDGAAWVSQGSYDFANLAATPVDANHQISGSVTHVSRNGDEAVIVYHDDTCASGAEHCLKEVIYSHSDLTPSMTVPAEIGDVAERTGTDPFVLKNRSDTLWLVYTDSNGAIVYKTKSPSANAGSWSSPTSILSLRTEFPNAIPLGIEFLPASTQPVLFFAANTGPDSQYNLFSASPSLLSTPDETCLPSATAPDGGLLDSNEISAYELFRTFGAAYAGFMDVDAVGRLYYSSMLNGVQVYTPEFGPWETWRLSTGLWAYPLGVAVSDVFDVAVFSKGPFDTTLARDHGIVAEGGIEVWSLACSGELLVTCEDCSGFSPLNGACEQDLDLLTPGLGAAGDVAIDDSLGYVYASSPAESRIEVYRLPDFTHINSIEIGAHGGTERPMPYGIDLDASGALYVVDPVNHQLQKLVLNSQDELVYDETLGSWVVGGQGKQPAQFRVPLGVSADDAYGRLYVTDSWNNRVQVLSLNDGGFLYEWSAWDLGDEQGEFLFPQTVLADERGSVFVTDAGDGVRLHDFQINDTPPTLSVDVPQSCAVLVGEGNIVSGTSSDDWANVRTLSMTLSREDGTVECTGTVLDFVGGAFAFACDVVDDGSADQRGILHVTATDHIGQSTNVFRSVKLFGPGEPIDDPDEDGIHSLCDNCPLDANSSQADCDIDGFGDACRISGGFDTDCDFDLVPDSCQMSATPLQVDINLNGVFDACETRVYVDTDIMQSGSGLAWGSGYNRLEDALAHASELNGNVKEIWIAEGTYSGDEGSGFGFRLPDGTSLYGGFRGDEGSLAERFIGVYETILTAPAGKVILGLDQEGAGSGTVIDGIVFSNGIAIEGAAIGLGGGSSPTIRNCAFRNNMVDTHGGGAVSISGGAPVFENCVFGGNAAAGDLLGGGAVLMFGGNPSFRNCLFSGGSSENGAGGAIQVYGGAVSLENCTFANNTSGTGAGGGISIMSSFASVSIVNSILRDNGGTFFDDQISNTGGGSLSVSYSNVQGWPTPGSNGNIDADPLFVDPDGFDDVFGTEDDDYHLMSQSPSIDAGDNTLVMTELDLDGIPRKLNDLLTLDNADGHPPLVDMGAYEVQSYCVYDRTCYDLSIAQAQLHGVDPSDVLDVCNYHYCHDGICRECWRRHGNTCPSYQGFVQTDDILCATGASGGFGNYGACPNADVIRSESGVGLKGPSGVPLGTDDILALVDAFGGLNPFGCPADKVPDGVPICDDGVPPDGEELPLADGCGPSGAGMSAMATMVGEGESFDPSRPSRVHRPGKTSFGRGSTFGLRTQVVSGPSAASGGGDYFEVDVYVAGASGIAGYEAGIEAEAIGGGSIVLDSLFIDRSRPDFLFFGIENHVATDMNRGRIGGVAVLAEVSATTENPGYIGTFRFRVDEEPVTSITYEFITEFTGLWNLDITEIRVTANATAQQAVP